MSRRTKPADLDAFLNLPKHRPGFIRGIGTGKQFRSVAQLIAVGQRKFEARKRKEKG